MLKDFKGAITDQTKAIEINSNNGDAYRNRGLAKEGIFDYSGAISDYSNSIKIDSNSADSYNNRGAVRKKPKDYTGAIKDFNKAIEIDPENVYAYYNRGIAECIIGRTESGCSDLTKASGMNHLDAYYAIQKYCK